MRSASDCSPSPTLRARAALNLPACLALSSSTSLDGVLGSTSAPPLRLELLTGSESIQTGVAGIHLGEGNITKHA